MGLQRELALMAMRGTPLPGRDDFLTHAGVATPVPTVPGSLGGVARECFDAFKLKHPFDLVVVFTMGDFPAGSACSAYFDPESPWYNVFYGAYGIRSYKADGGAWGFTTQGHPDIDEMLQVVRLDYDYLTAGEMGCPPARMCFQTLSVEQGREGDWHTADVTCVVPSGLHRLAEAQAPDLTYYTVFGLPDARLLDAGRPSYEPVRMRGHLAWKPVGERLTLAWGGLFPDTPEGQALRQRVRAAQVPLYVR
ncbi:MAG: hypothetical protein EOO71_31565 [Myxococcaceae bacterium]|nr:MAG: hypothetical protein EOO71_31565 [Myxococcaceae bacterium]